MHKENIMLSRLIFIIFIFCICFNAWAMKHEYLPDEKKNRKKNFLVVNPDDRKSLSKYGLKKVTELKEDKKYLFRIFNKNKYPFPLQKGVQKIILVKGNHGRWYIQDRRKNFR